MESLSSEHRVKTQISMISLRLLTTLYLDLGDVDFYGSMFLFSWFRLMFVDFAVKLYFYFSIRFFATEYHMAFKRI